jgi:hypothetical protein
MPASVSGFNGERLNKCLALSDGEIGSIDSAEINNDTITSSQWNTSTGVVSSGPYAGYIRIYPKLGLASQTSEPAALQAAGWSVDHRGDGIAYVYLFFTASNDVYKSGAPTVVVFNGTGKKIYDPRLDTSPGAHPTTSTYAAFSTNPANILADFLTWYAGGSEAPAKVLWSDVVTAANACDGSVTIPNGSGGTTTQSRYTCSIRGIRAADAEGTRRHDRDARARDDGRVLVRRWRVAHARGRVHVAVNAVRSPTTTFLGDSLNIATAQSRAQSGIFNTVRGSFTDQSQKTQPRPFPEVSSSSFIASDGEVLYTDAEFFTARTTYEAQRNAILAAATVAAADHRQRNDALQGLRPSALRRRQPDADKARLGQPDRARYPHSALPELHRRGRVSGDRERRLHRPDDRRVHRAGRGRADHEHVVRPESAEQPARDEPDQRDPARVGPAHEPAGRRGLPGLHVQLADAVQFGDGDRLGNGPDLGGGAAHRYERQLLLGRGDRSGEPHDEHAGAADERRSGQRGNREQRALGRGDARLRNRERLELDADVEQRRRHGGRRHGALYIPVDVHRGRYRASRSRARRAPRRPSARPDSPKAT